MSYLFGLLAFTIYKNLLIPYWIARTIFLLSGLKCHETMVNTINKVGPKSSIASSPTARCDTIAPDIAKKKPA
jgi:hypothetical protein